MVFERPQDLAAALYSIATRKAALFTGSSDHFVGDAFYFNDPRATVSSCTGTGPEPSGRGSTVASKLGGVFLNPTGSCRST